MNDIRCSGDALIAELLDILSGCEENMITSNSMSPNSFGAGYDQGRYEAFREILSLVCNESKKERGQVYPCGTRRLEREK